MNEVVGEWLIQHTMMIQTELFQLSDCLSDEQKLEGVIFS